MDDNDGLALLTQRRRAEEAAAIAEYEAMAESNTAQDTASSLRASLLESATAWLQRCGRFINAIKRPKVHSNLPVIQRLQLPVKGRGAPQTVAELRIAAICDEFTSSSLLHECHVCFLRPDGWQTDIAEFSPHVLFVESAWRGAGGSWQGRLCSADPVLLAVVAHCRASGIPTIFWNKEDPVHFEDFIGTAVHFDAVCTTDADCIPAYKRDLGHAQVFLMPFAVQPRLHHPLTTTPRIEGTVFAGAWYPNHAARCRDFIRLASALATAGPLHIFDRASAGYPRRYTEALRGAVAYEQTPDIYRQYRLGLTINTVTRSPSMFARRALELMGTGTSVYSNRSDALRELFGDLVCRFDDGDEALQAAFHELQCPLAAEYRLKRTLALRKVLSEHSWSERLTDLIERTYGHRLSKAGAVIWIVSEVGGTDDLQALVRMRDAQCGVDVRLAVAVPDGMELPHGVRRLNASELRDTPLAVFGEDALVAPWHAEDLYGPHYLHDLWLARSFGQGDVTGKACYVRQTDIEMELVGANVEYRHVGHLALRRCLFPSHVWRHTLGGLTTSIASGQIRGDRLVSIDGFSYVERGRGSALPESKIRSIYAGASIREIRESASAAAPAPAVGQHGTWTGAQLVQLFPREELPTGVSLAPRRHRLELVSRLRPGGRTRLRSRPMERQSFECGGRLRVGLIGSGFQGSVEIEAVNSQGGIVQSHCLGNYTLDERVLPGVDHYRIVIDVREHLVSYLDGIRVG